MPGVDHGAENSLCPEEERNIAGLTSSRISGGAGRIPVIMTEGVMTPAEGVRHMIPDALPTASLGATLSSAAMDDPSHPTIPSPSSSHDETWITTRPSSASTIKSNRSKDI